MALSMALVTAQVPRLCQPLKVSDVAATPWLDKFSCCLLVCNIVSKYKVVDRWVQWAQVCSIAHITLHFLSGIEFHTAWFTGWGTSMDRKKILSSQKVWDSDHLCKWIGSKLGIWPTKGSHVSHSATWFLCRTWTARSAVDSRPQAGRFSQEDICPVPMATPHFTVCALRMLMERAGAWPVWS